MFIVTFDQKQWSIPLVDFHTHIGKVKIETTKGSSQRINRPQDILDLYQKLKFELYNRISSKPEKYYTNLPSVDKFDYPMYPLVKDHFLKNYTRPQGWIVDHIVSFPFNDIFHLKTTPKFVKSNEYVRQQVQKAEFTFRFIPFCRVDVTDSDSSQEVIKSHRLGARGLKLHPLSQHWINRIVSDETKQVLLTAGKLNLPIIFDVPNKGVAKDITQISIEAREDAPYPINVVLGHNGFDYSSPEIFEYLSQKNMFTEVSGMRGADVSLFFKNVINVPNWEEKILFGSDANYFSVLQAVDFISYLLSYEFLDLIQNTQITQLKPLEIVSNILGLNAIKLIPKIHKENLEINNNKTYFIPITDINSKIKKFTKNKNNKITIDLIKRKNENKLNFLLSLGDENNLQSFLCSSESNLSKIILESCLEDEIGHPNNSNINNLFKLNDHQLSNKSETQPKQITNLEDIFMDN